jgi:type IV pilus assembly protein PilM
LSLQKQIEDIADTIKDALNIGPKSVVGVDIGMHSIKVAEVQMLAENSFKLVRYATVQLPEAAIIEDEIQKLDDIVECLKEALESSQISLKAACLGLSGPNTIARKLQLVGGSSEEELEDQVMWEAEQYLPFGLFESSIAFDVVGENEGGGVDVIVAAARNDTLESFKEIVELAELKAKIVDLSVLAFVNVFDHVKQELHESTASSYILIDIGAQKMDFVIFKNNSISFTKQMNIGCVMITEEIQRQLGVNYKEAEDLKITGDENGNLPEEILEIIDDVVESFFSEIKKTLDFYVTSTSDDSFDGCYVTGGGTLIPGLLEGLEALLGVKVEVLNPFEKITFDKNIPQSQINDIAYKGLVALGLGMRQLRE